MIYQFGNFQLDVDKFELRQNGVTLQVGPQVFDFLHLIIKNSDRLVSRDEVIEEVWDGRIVAETTVSSCVKAARRVLGDNGGQPRFIRTARGRGFQFIHEVEVIEASEIIASAKVAKSNQKSIPFIAVIGLLALILGGYLIYSQPANQRDEVAEMNEVPVVKMANTIAVLPFEDMSVDGNQDYFGRGVAEEVLNVLTSINGLDVTSRTSAFSIKNRNLSIPEISDELGVKYIVEGSVRNSGSRIRITAQLIDGETDTHLWSENYDRELVDIFAIQEEISVAIANVLQIELAGGELGRTAPTKNMEAYSLYLQGHQLFLDRGIGGDPARTGNLERGIVFLERAVELDPNFAAAWADIASSYILLPTYYERTYSVDDIASSAIDAVDRAIKFDPELSQAWAVKGYIHSNQFEFPDAETALIRAIELNPKNDTAWIWLGLHFATVGKHDRALEAVQKAIELTPDVTINYGVLGTILHASGDIDGAIKVFDQAIRERNYELGRADRALIAVWNNNMERAQEEIRKSTQRYGQDKAEQAYREMNIFMQAYVDNSYQQDSIALFNKNIQIGSQNLTFFTAYPSFFAAYFLRDGEKMIQFFETVADNRSFYIRRLYNPLVRPIFKQKIFRNYLIEIGLLAYWQTNGFPHFCHAVGQDDFLCE